MSKIRGLRIYDIAIDALRPVKQKDLDNFGELVKNWGRVCDVAKVDSSMLLSVINEERARLREVCK